MGYAEGIIEYAHKIGKNTAEFTVNDLVAFMKIWMKKGVSAVTPEQRKVYNKDVLAMRVWREKEKMAKHTTKKFEEAHISRLAELGIESPINDGEEEIVIHKDSEVVCSMELTKVDVEALLFSIRRIFEDYEMEKHKYGVSLMSLKEGLEGV